MDKGYCVFCTHIDVYYAAVNSPTKMPSWKILIEVWHEIGTEFPSLVKTVAILCMNSNRIGS